MLTIGQYLRPTADHLPIVRYWHPDEFAELERAAYALGFEHVAAGPLVRSHLSRGPARAAGGPGYRAAGRRRRLSRLAHRRRAPPAARRA